MSIIKQEKAEVVIIVIVSLQIFVGLVSLNSFELSRELEDDESYEIIGAVKLMDGLFLGDAICAEVLWLIEPVLGYRVS